MDDEKSSSFEKMGLSSETMKGLEDGGFSKPTVIQRKAIPAALGGQDVLGAAKTGSGKTIAFIIPILEKLHQENFLPGDGLGALILTPTRELAYQIFEVLRVVGAHHNFSAALVIGGKDLKFETNRMSEINILICTPGRLLQHMDQNYQLDCSSLQILVFDEADKILEMGFRETVDAIIENLPPDRQTLLFSATQTRKVEDLSRLALKDPEYVFAHESSAYATPKALAEQVYIVCPLQEKLNILYGFIKSNLKKKILVFLSTCKQVKFVNESFCKLQPGVPLMCLHGGMHQLKRMACYDKFCRKQFAVLFATDIASRGLDFPDVDWVVQVDCPEDVKTYIHRVGRTARKGSKNEGQAFLMLQNHEVPFVSLLKEAKVPITEMDVDESKMRIRTEHKFRSFNAELVELHETAKRAFVAYCKFVHLSKNNDIFSVAKLNLDGFARSLGLVSVPRLRFLKDSKVQSEVQKKTRTKRSFFESDEVDCLKSLLQSVDDNFDDNPLVAKKTKHTMFADDEVNIKSGDKEEGKVKVKTAAKQAKILKRKKIAVHQHIKFEADQNSDDLKQEDIGDEEGNETLELDNADGINIEALREKLRAKNRPDKDRKQKLMREKRQEKKRKKS